MPYMLSSFIHKSAWEIWVIHFNNFVPAMLIRDSESSEMNLAREVWPKTRVSMVAMDCHWHKHLAAEHQIGQQIKVFESILDKSPHPLASGVRGQLHLLWCGGRHLFLSTHDIVLSFVWSLNFKHIKAIYFWWKASY